MEEESIWVVIGTISIVIGCIWVLTGLSSFNSRIFKWYKSIKEKIKSKNKSACIKFERKYYIIWLQRLESGRVGIYKIMTHNLPYDINVKETTRSYNKYEEKDPFDLIIGTGRHTFFNTGHEDEDYIVRHLRRLDDLIAAEIEKVQVSNYLHKKQIYLAKEDSEISRKPLMLTELRYTFEKEPSLMLLEKEFNEYMTNKISNDTSSTPVKQLTKNDIVNWDSYKEATSQPFTQPTD